MSDKARIAAFHAVKRILGGAYSNLIQPDSGLSGLDRAFAESIALGTLERKLTLDFALRELFNKAPKADIFALLMTGAYQILYMDRVPDSAACDETVSIAKKLFGAENAGFVNAVLRALCRNKAIIEDRISKAEGYIKYSVNQELFQLIKEQYPKDYNEIFEAFFGSTPMFLRVNTLKADAESVAEAVGGEIINQKCVAPKSPKEALAMIEKGLFYVQGLASQKAVELLEAEPGQRVIDVCACPGGKTLGAAMDMGNKGRIYSFDLHDKKIPIIEKSARLLGIDIISACKRDAKTPDESLFGTADRVICDVPCSGTGVMGSKPEIKYKSPSDFEGLYKTQRAIIAASADYLKAGGWMVYSTCSINKKENEEIIEGFLSEHPEFSLSEMKTYLPQGETKEGFFVAKIRRDI